MYKKIVVILMLGFVSACSEDEKPAFAPVIEDAKVVCKTDSNLDYELVDKIIININDIDRDLVVDKTYATVNGVKIAFTDGEKIDDIFEWTPPASWDPPMMCRGDFRISVRAYDASGLSTQKRFVLKK